jgi:hypothetical protein
MFVAAVNRHDRHMALSFARVFCPHGGLWPQEFCLVSRMGRNFESVHKGRQVLLVKTGTKSAATDVHVRGDETSHFGMRDKGKRRTNNSDQHSAETMEDNDSESTPLSFNRSFGLTFIYRSCVVVL